MEEPKYLVGQFLLAMPGMTDPRVPLLRERLGVAKATMEIATADGETAEVESRI